MIRARNTGFVFRALLYAAGKTIVGLAWHKYIWLAALTVGILLIYISHSSPVELPRWIKKGFL